MRLVLTQHANEALLERSLDLAWVRAAVLEPDWVAPDRRPGVERRFKVLPELQSRMLRVAVVAERDHIRVLTAHLDRDARRPNAP